MSISYLLIGTAESLVGALNFELDRFLACFHACRLGSNNYLILAINVTIEGRRLREISNAIVEADGAHGHRERILFFLTALKDLLFVRR